MGHPKLAGLPVLSRILLQKNRIRVTNTLPNVGRQALNSQQRNHNMKRWNTSCCRPCNFFCARKPNTPSKLPSDASTTSMPRAPGDRCHSPKAYGAFARACHFKQQAHNSTHAQHHQKLCRHPSTLPKSRWYAVCHEHQA